MLIEFLPCPSQFVFLPLTQLHFNLPTCCWNCIFIYHITGSHNSISVWPFFLLPSGLLPQAPVSVFHNEIHYKSFFFQVSELIHLFILLLSSLVSNNHKISSLLSSWHLFSFWPFGFKLELLKSHFMSEWLIYLTTFLSFQGLSRHNMAFFQMYVKIFQFMYVL